jgi:hypothetical protein
MLAEVDFRRELKVAHLPTARLKAPPYGFVNPHTEWMVYR